MPRITDIMVFQQKEIDTLVIRKRTRVQDLPQLIGECYGKIAAYLGENHQLMSDIPFVAYHNMDMQDLDVEIGFPVAKPLPDNGDIKTAVIPPGLVVWCMYQGPYSELKTTYDEMASWIQNNGYNALGTAYECYFNGPEYPEHLLLTKIMFPVEKLSSKK
ncbi:GyrI-like domain-containing protein [Dehalogenimonas sp. 4OHTPN]|uniref:GyrI-like domain-containing protein n=1 Tax=Dehalogenimonas sp. 4OHTPN TaxID=3166643 RepID=A0AAU8GD89_9CHLR